MKENLKGYVAIGDIHGCSKTLTELLRRLENEFGETRTYVFVGDYVDRGPHSKEVVDILIEFNKSHDCVFLRGNHDAMLLRYQQDKSWVDWFDYGGDATMESYYQSCPDSKIPYAHLKFFINTKLYYEAEDFLFVHGGLPIDKTVAEALADESIHSSFLWTRDHINKEVQKWEKTVIFGHTPDRSPIHRKNMIGIDTGCVYQQYGKLTAVALPERDFIQQKNIDF